MASTIPQARVVPRYAEPRDSILQKLQTIFLSGRLAKRTLALLIFFGIWQALCMIGFKFFINFQLIPSPWEVLKATVEFLPMIQGCIFDRACFEY